MGKDLSAILLVGHQRERGTRALQSLLKQDARDKMEIIVFDCMLEDVAPIPGSEDPIVRYNKLDSLKGFGEIRAEGVRMAQAPIVAFIEEHAFAGPGWASNIIKAHQQGAWAGVGGEMIAGNKGIGTSDGVSFTHYSSAMEPAQRGVSHNIPGMNSSYKRNLLMKYDNQLEQLMLAEIVLQWRLQQDGYEVYIDPDIKITHYNETALKSIAVGSFLLNRCLGAIRAEVFNWSLLKRIVRIILAPLSPWSRLARMLTFYYSRRPALLRAFLFQLPVVAFSEFVSVAGHTTGLLLGIGHADKQYTIYETSEPRAEQ